MELFDVGNLLSDEGALGLTLVMPENNSKGKQARFLKQRAGPHAVGDSGDAHGQPCRRS